MRIRAASQDPPASTNQPSRSTTPTPRSRRSRGCCRSGPCGAARRRRARHAPDPFTAPSMTCLVEPGDRLEALRPGPPMNALTAGRSSNPRRGSPARTPSTLCVRYTSAGRAAMPTSDAAMATTRAAPLLSYAQVSCDVGLAELDDRLQPVLELVLRVVGDPRDAAAGSRRRRSTTRRARRAGTA